MQHNVVLKKLNFDLLTPRVRGGGVCSQNISYHIATFCDSNKFDMQDDHVLKKLNFDLLTSRVRGRRSASKIFATMLLHFVSPFNLICNITMFSGVTTYVIALILQTHRSAPSLVYKVRFSLRYKDYTNK